MNVELVRANVGRFRTRSGRGANEVQTRSKMSQTAAPVQKSNLEDLFKSASLPACLIGRCCFLFRFLDCTYSFVLFALDAYSSTPLLLYSSTPLLLYSSTPLLLCSSTPLLLCSSTPLLLYSSTPLLLCSSAPLLLYHFLNILLPKHPKLPSKSGKKV